VAEQKMCILGVPEVIVLDFALIARRPSTLKRKQKTCNQHGKKSYDPLGFPTICILLWYTADTPNESKVETIDYTNNASS
jgi:hypothetical protein